MSILIIGGGEIGRFIADRLIREGKEVLVIEKDERVADEIKEELDAKVICGNGAAPRVLREAEMGKAEMVVAVTDSDEVNLLATMLAGMEAPQAVRIARIRNREFDIEGESLQHDLHINLVINPDKVAARAILRVLEIPGASDMMDFFDGNVKLVGAPALKSSPLINRPLKDMTRLWEDGRFLVAAIFHNGEFSMPTGDSKIVPGDTVYFVSQREHMADGMRLLGHRGEKARDIMIAGGGFVGLNLAAGLEKRGVNVKIVEQDPRLCSALSRGLGKPVILNATATDEDFLKEENIASMDAFVAVTRDDEENILSSLLAKRLGCPIAIAISHKAGYLPIISSLGIDVVLSPRQLTIDGILHFIRKGKVLQASSLREAAEIIEVEALETTDLVGRPIKDVRLPKGVLILSVKRKDEIVVPWGDTVIQPGDRVLLISSRDAVPKVEKFITVKLEYF